MKGLLIKDLRLLTGQKQFFVSIFVTAGILLLTGQNDLFLISFLTLTCGRFAVSTIAYDEQNNGYAFLFALPAGRTMYALEKYLLGLTASAVCWIATTGAAAVFLLVRARGMNMTELLAGSAVLFFLPGIMLSWMIPMQLKFGTEKSQLLSFAFVAGFFAVLLLVMKVLVPYFRMEWIAIGVCVYVAVLVVSVLVSIRVIKKKEF